MSSLVAAGHILIGANIAPALAGLKKTQAALNATAASGKKSHAALNASAKVAAAGLAGLALGTAVAIKAAGDFESSLNDMRAVSGATASQMKQVSKAAIALGADAKLPGTSAKDAADAMTQLAKGGFSAKEAMDAARGTLLLSAAAGIDNAQAATIQADALNGFGLSAKSAGKVSDLLAASANASTAEITDMAMSLSQSAAVAKQANYSIEDTVTALSMLANAGIKGSDAGTSLKTMLLRLQAPLGPAKAAIKELGINLRDSGGELKKLPALANEFTNATKNLDRAQRDAAFAAIFGSDAIRAANILLGQGASAHDNMKKKVTEQGAAQQLAAAKMQGFNGAIEGFRSSVETLAIELGTKLLPAATSAVNGMTSFSEWMSKNQGTVQNVAIAAASLGAAIITVAAGMKIAAAATALWGAAMAASPLLLFVGAAVGVGVAIGLITRALGGGASAMDRFTAASQAAKAALAGLQDSGNSLKGAHLAHKAAILEVKSANQGLAAVQQQVANGEIKGKDASLAIAQAKLRVEQANLGVKTSSKGVSDAITAERTELVKHNVETRKQIDAAKDRVTEAKAAIAIYGATKENVERLRSAQTALAVASAKAGTVTADTAGNVRVAGSAAADTAAKVGALRSKMDEIKSKAVSIDVNTEAAMFNVLRLVGSMLQVASKTVTLTVKTNHVKGSWNDQETIENLRKEPTKRSFSLFFKSHGTGPLEGHLTTVRTLQGKLDKINADRAAKDRQLALADAQRALAEAKRKGEGVAAAERAVNRARQDITIAGIEARLAIAQKGADREKAIVDKMNERIKKGIADLKRARDNAANLASGLGGMIGQGVDALSGRNLALLGNSPEAQRLRDIETQQRGVALMRERARLDEAIREAETTEDRMQAQSDLDDWLLEQERQTIATSLAAKEQAIRDEAEAKKTATERGLADLTSAFNRGLMTHQQYIASVNHLVGAQVGDYNSLGSMLGGAFRFGFEEQLQALFATVSNVAKLVAPGSAAARVTLPAGPDRPPRRAKLGGIVGGSGLTDKVPLLAAPGEGVLSHRGMDNLMEMAMDGHRGGGGGASSLVVNIYDRTTTGMSREQARRLADQIAPELNRRVALAG